MNRMTDAGTSADTVLGLDHWPADVRQALAIYRDNERLLELERMLRQLQIGGAPIMIPLDGGASTVASRRALLNQPEVVLALAAARAADPRLTVRVLTLFLFGIATGGRAEAELAAALERT
jgi:hypothetical protein